LSRVCSWNGPYKSAISSGFIRLLQLFYKLADSGIFPATSYKRLVHSFTSCYPHRSILSTASHCPPSHTSRASFRRDWRYVIYCPWNVLKMLAPPRGLGAANSWVYMMLLLLLFLQ
jgi:hypothetical protein